MLPKMDKEEEDAAALVAACAAQKEIGLAPSL